MIRRKVVGGRGVVLSIAYGLLSLVGILPLAMMMALPEGLVPDDDYWLRVLAVFMLVGALVVIIAGLWFTLWCVRRALGWDYL